MMRPEIIENDDDGKNIYEVAEILRKCERTIKEWLGRWNKEGYTLLLRNGRENQKAYQ